MTYLPRLIEKEIERRLISSGAIVVEGPKFCGKTTTSSIFAKSEIKLNSSNTISLAKLSPKGILQGDVPRLIDEWQTVPDIWNNIREVVDERQQFGQFILTGSATPAEKEQIYHSGAGRITPIVMRTMSLYESLDSKGTVSLTNLFDNPESPIFDMNDGIQLSDIAFLICRGGWPLSLQKDRKVALDVTRNYYKGLFNFEYSENKKFRNKKPEIMKAMLKSYARNISTEASRQTIISDIVANNNRTMNERTFDEYLEALKDLFIIEDISAWCPNLRSKTSIRTSPTRHFIDTSIACMSLNISPSDLMKDIETFGLFFEDMVIRDLKVYSMLLHGEVSHYRDSRGLECDAVLHLEDGRWAMIEVKLGGEKLINEGAENLIKIRKDINESKDPEFMMVITAVGAAYRREDGIYVVPINCLKA